MQRLLLYLTPQALIFLSIIIILLVLDCKQDLWWSVCWQLITSRGACGMQCLLCVHATPDWGSSVITIQVTGWLVATTAMQSTRGGDVLVTGMQMRCNGCSRAVCTLAIQLSAVNITSAVHFLVFIPWDWISCRSAACRHRHLLVWFAISHPQSLLCVNRPEAVAHIGCVTYTC